MKLLKQEVQDRTKGMRRNRAQAVPELSELCLKTNRARTFRWCTRGEHQTFVPEKLEVRCDLGEKRAPEPFNDAQETSNRDSRCNIEVLPQLICLSQVSQKDDT